MRVVFFLQGKEVPAARFRGLVIAEALARNGMETVTRAPVPSVYGDLPRRWRLYHLRPLFVPWVLFVRLAHLRCLRPDDIVFFQRPMLEMPLTFLERMVARRHKTILDFDDAIHCNWRGKRKVRRLVEMVDHVIVGNDFLAQVAGAPEKTTVIPTVVDLDRYIPSPARRTRGRDVVVGWTGLSCNYRHLVTAADGIAHALDKTSARFVVISDRPPPASLQALRPEFVPWSAAREIEDLNRLDIGVMPLPDGEHERGKCAFKLIQYMALAKCGLTSPVGANTKVVTDGVDGFLPIADGDWTDRLVRLIEDPGSRALMGVRARERIRSHYSLEAVLPDYQRIIYRVAGGAHG
jgi:glycosyltransferase involved in cell wall biosynthesis